MARSVLLALPLASALFILVSWLWDVLHVVHDADHFGFPLRVFEENWCPAELVCRHFYPGALAADLAFFYGIALLLLVTQGHRKSRNICDTDS